MVTCGLGSSILFLLSFIWLFVVVFGYIVCGKLKMLPVIELAMALKPLGIGLFQETKKPILV